MGLLKKSKDIKEETDEILDGEDDEDEEGGGRVRKFKKRDFKDLHPENKKKRKEPAKPWGRKERIIILLLIISTAGYAAIMYLSHSDIKLPMVSVPKFESLKLPDLPKWSEKTYIIENDQNTGIR